MDMETVAAAHAARIARLDPLAGVVVAPDPGDDDLTWSAAADGGHAIGVASTSHAEPRSEASLWGPLTTHSLRLWADEAGTGPAVTEVMDRWDRHLREVAQAGDVEHGATVVVHSRDEAMVLALTRAGFAPTVGIAVRRHRARSAPATPPSGIEVATADADDLDVLTDMAEAVHTTDVAFGGVSARPDARAVLAGALERALETAPGWTWVARDGDDVVGFCQVQPPAEAGWIAAATALEPAAYLGYAYVVPHLRTGGVGAQLVAAAHARLDDAQVAGTLLHHSVANSRSTPFWARQGYRPLRTAWQRRPAVRT